MKISTTSFSIVCLFLLAISGQLPANLFVRGETAGAALVAPTYGNDPNLATALEAITTDFQQGLVKLEVAIAVYQEAAYTNKLADIRASHSATRIAFKEVEWLLEYLDAESIKKYINGAPLPKTEPNVPEVVVIEPTGLQRLDELVWEDEPDYTAIQEMTAKLASKFAEVKKYALFHRMHHRYVFEAIRFELVRLYTLGVTGFDTPASGTALPESMATLQVLQKSYHHYATAVSAVDTTVDQRIQRAFTSGLEQLKGGDFDAFDRLAFLVEVVNPLTSSLPLVQQLLNIEFEQGAPNQLNQHAELLFDADWFNADFFAKQPTSEFEAERIELGRLLFYDPVLSSNLKRSCASCHHPDQAFTDGNARSLAIDGKGTILRNSPTLINSVYAEKYFYDLREDRLDRQIKHVVRDSLEFATDFIEITQKLAQSEEYMALFNAAYPEHPQYSLSRYSISDALARYVKTLRAHNSPFDRMARGEIDIVPEVAAGYNLFMGKAACGTCHFAPAFSGLVPPYYRESESEVLGVPATKVWENARIDPDLGRIYNSRPADEAYFNAFAFKTPTVRNAALTAPYMHNGVYSTLEEVMDFYNRGGGAGIGSYVEHQTLPPDALELKQEEIGHLITFMQSLTDTTGLTSVPERLPTFAGQPEWNRRIVGGDY